MTELTNLNQLLVLNPKLLTNSKTTRSKVNWNKVLKLED